MVFLNVLVGKLCLGLVVIVEDIDPHKEVLTDYGEQYWYDQ
jgi:hypothetical protein